MFVAGADGCPGGWAVVLIDIEHGDARLRLARSFGEIAVLPESPVVIGVDMPTGLPERVGPGGRGPERLIRPLLGERQSSVFSVPSRSAVYAADYAQACALALSTSDPPRKVAKQCFHLFPKIREVDAALRADPAHTARIFECHPEAAFWRANGERPLGEPKKVSGRPYGPGLALRRYLLGREGFDEQFLAAAPPRGMGVDDLLDACACAVTAKRIALGIARSFPDPPGKDSHSLPVAIWV
jgi:predicted RNase H-like nuclease